MRRPRLGLTWIRLPHVQHKLRALATGQVPLTHEGLSELGTSRATAYLRDLLMEHGALPRRDRYLLMFESWLTNYLDDIDAPHRALIDQFATWHILRKLRDIAARQPVGHHRTGAARRKIIKAAEFLAWLAGRSATIRQCTQ